MVASITSVMLEELGHTIIEANSAQHALAVLRSDNAIDVVITDHAMPDTTGAELAAQVRHEWPGLPIGLISGYIGLLDDANPDFPRLSKPYRQDQLAELVASLVAKKGSPETPREDHLMPATEIS